MQAVRRGRFGPTSSLKRDADSAHVEDVNNQSQQDGVTKSSAANKKYPFVPESLSDDDLPFIAKDLVLGRSKQFKSRGQAISDREQTLDNEYWIVIDSIVYDCSDFAAEHPGGEDVIMSFVGEDCSWQFWRLHGKSVMEQYGRALRVGRTEGIKNRFPESVRYVGLSKLGDDGW
jgi:cytochrome b involved in lipid metabolism